ncbi:four-carbon acid sugar kinase family protein [Paenibacillus sp. LHD-38]|uniref:four-carbon acid sugar kinase family protein n=1 Tax=Paenibacillus sp. LHD-38 TaxID=3072143 RepID=UPI00280C7154|nr:four-carbon acid sugar kinase family protein [Paenibacillus sp. LHD-38]MDQ8735126.1 four-carbon acid sugar kinase family protein [Paenibacillus sp. LHD-38]
MNSEAKRTTLAALQNELPLEWDNNGLRQEIKRLNNARGRKIIVLDDDPTGVQTVHDINVLTMWDKELLREAFDAPETLFYILTNTRGLDAAAAEQINREIARNVQAVAAEKDKGFTFVSRSDSMLRGYYPLETDVLSDEVLRVSGRAYDGQLIIPAFFEAGRITLENTHYMVENQTLIPVHETEFAKDKVFGYENGDLTEWVEEKTEGRIQAGQCLVISLDQIRKGPEAVKEVLLGATGNMPIIVNALTYADMDVLSLSLLQAEEQGKSFIFRTAASFVKSYAGISDQGYLPQEKLIADKQQSHGGIVVVGSYVQKTTRQLEQLLTFPGIVSLEIDVESVLDPEGYKLELGRVIAEANKHIAEGRNVVVYSSRKLIAVDNKADNFKISRTVSGALVEIVKSLEVVPKFIIAKGGITSSDVATKGLAIRKARVLGQVAAGIPVWLTGAEAKFSGIPYIVFPGNVGDERTLLETVEKIEVKK